MDRITDISKKKIFQKKQRETYIFVLLVVGPTFAAFLLFTFYPNIMSLYYSLLEWDGLSKPKFVGLDNFVMMFKDTFMWNALYHNLLMAIVIPVFTILISVVLADLLVTRTFKENGFYKVLFFFPNVLSIVVLALMWSFIYDGQFGLLNSLIRVIGIDIGQFYWLGEQKFALAAVMVPLIWCNVSFYLIVFMNAMTSIPKSIYESAYLDGITNTRRLFSITLPLISGIVRIAVILMILLIFKSFELIMILTRGGPGGATDVIGYYMFSYAFASNSAGRTITVTNYGYASAIGLLLFVILVGFKVMVDKFGKEESVEF